MVASKDSAIVAPNVSVVAAILIGVLDPSVIPPAETVAPPVLTVRPPVSVAPPAATVIPPAVTVMPPAVIVAPPAVTVKPPLAIVIPPVTVGVSRFTLLAIIDEVISSLPIATVGCPSRFSLVDVIGSVVPENV